MEMKSPQKGMESYKKEKDDLESEERADVLEM